MTASSPPDEHSVTIARIPEAHVLDRSVGYTRAALRTGSRVVLNLLAGTLTRGEHDLAGFADRLRSGSVPADWYDSPRRNAFASLLTAMSPDETQADAALAGWLLLQQACGTAGIGETAQLLLAQLALRAGRPDVVRTVLAATHRLQPTIRHSLEADLANPYPQDRSSSAVPIDPAAHETWERLLSAPFAQAGLAPPTVSPTEVTLFDGLAAPSSPTEDGPLVSVIMPSYRPDAGLLTSVRSILAQTHAHLELIIVDDGSGPDSWRWYEQAQALDARVRVLTLESNGGTYSARNAGLRGAAGEYLTFQDSDDWSHPERLRVQLRALQKEPEASGSRSEAIRATDDLRHQWLGYPPRRQNASSLMIRREVLAAVGLFDPVRKSADSEFYERIQHACGPVVDVPQPLAITRLRSGTLSRSDFRYGWMHPERLLYREAYRHWHRTTDELRMPVEGPRPFAAPASFTTFRGELDPVEVDVLVLADLSAGMVDLERFDALLALAAASELTVGVLHQEDALQAREQRPDLEPEVLERVARSQCVLLTPTAPVEARVALVPDPHLLLTCREPRPMVRTTAVLTVAGVPTGADEVVDHLAVSDACRYTFGRRPRWVTRSERDRISLTEDGFIGLGLLAEEIELLNEEVGMIGEGAGPH